MKAQAIMELCDMILPGASKNRLSGRCPTCRDKIDPDGFKDNVSREEFALSGMCQKCQDKVFTPQLTPRKKK